MSGQDAEQEAEDRVREDEHDAFPQLAKGLRHVAQTEAGGELFDVADALLLRGREDLADPEQPDRHRDEADSREQRDLTEVQALLAGDRVEPDRREQQPEREHREALHRRLGAQSDEGRE